MRVSFNEEANVFVPDNLSAHERKKMWTHAPSNVDAHEAYACTQGKRKTKRGDSVHLAAILEYIVLNSSQGDHRVEILKERRQQVRTFVRCIIDEHNSLKEMGLTNTVSLCRMSSVCSKTGVVMAQQRAASQAQQLAQTYYRNSVQCPQE